MSPLDQQRICEEISAWFEPMPPSIYPDSISGIPSAKGFWKCQGSEGWSPLNYFTDEAANARLLEAMPYPTLTKFSGKKGAISTSTPFWSCYAMTQEPAEHEDRKTAIVLAFCKFAGIDAEESR